MSGKEHRLSFELQRQHVVQLSRDRKNGYGGYAAGLKDFAEMGPPSGEHWPLSAESIRRAFGVPQEDDDPASTYVLLLRAESHAALEQAARELRAHAPGLHAAWSAAYSVDLGGDRDHDAAKSQAERAAKRAQDLADSARDTRREARRHRALARELTGKLQRIKDVSGREALGWEEAKKLARERRRQLDLWKRKMGRAGELEQEAVVVHGLAWGPRSLAAKADLFLDLLTLALRDHELVVQFARQQTRLEEQAQDDRDRRVWDEYQELLVRHPKKVAREMVCNAYGIHDRTLARIEESKREELGLEKRPRGRPPKARTEETV